MMKIKAGQKFQLKKTVSKDDFDKIRLYGNAMSKLLDFFSLAKNKNGVTCVLYLEGNANRPDRVYFDFCDSRWYFNENMVEPVCPKLHNHPLTKVFV